MHIYIYIYMRMYTSYSPIPRCFCALPFSAVGLGAQLPAELGPRGPAALRGQCHASGGCPGHRGAVVSCR